MQSCSFCDASVSGTDRCSKCGWGPYSWPFEDPLWERAHFFDFSGAWLQTLWQLMAMPRFFFSRFGPSSRLVSVTLFALPVMVLMTLFMMMHLPHAIDQGAMTGQEAFMPFVDDFMDEMARMSATDRFVSVLAGTFQSVFVWVFVLSFCSLCLSLGSRLTVKPSLTFTQSYRIFSYSLVPGLVLSLFFFVIAWVLVDPNIGYPPPGSALAILTGQYATIMLWALTFLWPYFLTLTAIEEALGIGRLKAQTVVLASIVVGLFQLVLLVGCLGGV